VNTCTSAVAACAAILDNLWVFHLHVHCIPAFSKSVMAWQAPLCRTVSVGVIQVVLSSSHWSNVVDMEEALCCIEPGPPFSPRFAR
jgi:hypothetical protein